MVDKADEIDVLIVRTHRTVQSHIADLKNSLTPIVVAQPSLSADPQPGRCSPSQQAASATSSDLPELSEVHRTNLSVMAQNTQLLAELETIQTEVRKLRDHNAVLASALQSKSV